MKAFANNQIHSNTLASCIYFNPESQPGAHHHQSCRNVSLKKTQTLECSSKAEKTILFFIWLVRSFYYPQTWSSWFGQYCTYSASSHIAYSKHMLLKSLVFCNFLFSNHVNSSTAEQNELGIILIQHKLMLYL